MVWSCISSNGVRILRITNKIIERFAYLDILKKNLKTSVEKLVIKENFIF